MIADELSVRTRNKIVDYERGLIYVTPERYQRFVQNLQWFLENSSIRQYDLATMIGLHPVQLSYALRGRRNELSLTMQVQCARVLGIEPDDLYKPPNVFQECYEFVHHSAGVDENSQGD